MKTSEGLKQSYDNQYSDSIINWRYKAAKAKANNIIELTGYLKPANVLEVGCGEGSILHWLDQANFCESLFAVDISESGIQKTQSRNIASLKEAQIFDGYHLPYPDNYFDLAYCSHVIEHVEFPRQVIREIKRVSNHQFYEIPIDFSFYVDKKVDHFLSYGHINIFTPGLFRFLLHSEGHHVLNDKCGFFSREIMAHHYDNNIKGFLLFQIKTFILSFIPYMKGIKPNFYCALLDKTREVKIL